MKHNTLVLDLGSHASRIAVFSPRAELLDLKSSALDSQCDGARVEQSPAQMLSSFETLLEQLNADQLDQIASAGLCTQRSSFLAWDRRSGEALSPVISWRDLRSQGALSSWSAEQDKIQAISGLRLSAHYSASKMHWLVTEHPELLQNPNLCLSPIASYLLFHLLDKATCAIDHSNAQRTLLFDHQRCDWSPELLALFELPAACLPDCYPIVHPYGQLKTGNIPVQCVCGDQNAAFHAYPDLGQDDVLINLGTGGFILSDIAEKRPRSSQPPRLLSSLVYSDPSQRRTVTEATINGTGAALSWLQETQASNSGDFYNQLETWLGQIEPEGIFMNSVSGFGSPWWCSPGEPGFIPENGMDIAQKYVALIESIVFMLFHNLQQLEQLPERIFISGGLSQLDGLCQKLSSLAARPVLRYHEIEATALGCARLAHVTTTEFNLHNRAEKTYHPATDTLLAERYKQFVGEIQKRCP